MLMVATSGRLTSDPTITATGACHIDLATNTTRFAEDGQRKSLFIRVNVWGKRGENCARYLKKGDMLFAYGELEVTNYKDRNGEPKYALNMLNANIEFGPKAQINVSPTAPPQYPDSEDIFG